MNRTRIGLCAALLLLVILVVSAPARILTAFVPGQQLILQGVSGTVWKGVSSRALVAVEGGYLHLGRLSWSLSPGSMLLLRPTVEVHSQWGSQRINAVVTYRPSGNMELTAVDALVPAALVRQFVPLQLSGEFAMQLSWLDIVDGLPVAGEGRLVWSNGGWTSPSGERSLGSYAIDFAPSANASMVGAVMTLSGALEASGGVSLDGRDYAVDIVLTGSGLDDPQLKRALQLIAIAEGESYRVVLDGAF